MFILERSEDAVRLLAHLAQAERRVIECEMRVTKQLMSIANLVVAGLDTTKAKELLEVIMLRLTFLYTSLKLARANAPN